MTPTTCAQTFKSGSSLAAALDPCVADVVIVGGSGYTGALLAELLLRHPSVRLTHVSSETLAGTPVTAHLLRVRADLDFCAQAEVSGVDVALVCTPHGEAAPVVKRLVDDGARPCDSPHMRQVKDTSMVHRGSASRASGGHLALLDVSERAMVM